MSQCQSVAVREAGILVSNKSPGSSYCFIRETHVAKHILYYVVILINIKSVIHCCNLCSLGYLFNVQIDRALSAITNSAIVREGGVLQLSNIETIQTLDAVSESLLNTTGNQQETLLPRDLSSTIGYLNSFATCVQLCVCVC